MGVEGVLQREEEGVLQMEEVLQREKEVVPEVLLEGEMEELVQKGEGFVVKVQRMVEEAGVEHQKVVVFGEWSKWKRDQEFEEEV